MTRQPYYHERREHGLCVDCRATSPHFVRCDRCRQHRLDRRKTKPSLKGRRKAK